MRRTCKRCGKCCENIAVNFSERQATNSLKKAVVKNSFGDILEMSMILRCLIWEKKRKDGRWSCTCRYYQAPKKKSPAGCLVYAGRPYMCKDYPYGKPREEGCSYKMEIRKKKGQKDDRSKTI